MSNSNIILIIAIFNFVLGFFVLKSDISKALNRWFGVCAALIGIWVLLNYFFQNDSSVFLLRLIYAFAPFIINSAFMWTAYLKVKTLNPTFKTLNWIAFLLNTLFAFLLLTNKSIIISASSYTEYQTGQDSRRAAPHLGQNASSWTSL